MAQVVGRVPTPTHGDREDRDERSHCKRRRCGASGHAVNVTLSRILGRVAVRCQSGTRAMLPGR